jgi:hypothetical protein
MKLTVFGAPRVRFGHCVSKRLGYLDEARSSG